MSAINPDTSRETARNDAGWEKEGGQKANGDSRAETRAQSAEAFTAEKTAEIGGGAMTETGGGAMIETDGPAAFEEAGTRDRGTEKAARTRKTS